MKLISHSVRPRLQPILLDPKFMGHKKILCSIHVHKLLSTFQILQKVPMMKNKSLSLKWLFTLFLPQIKKTFRWFHSAKTLLKKWICINKCRSSHQVSKTQILSDIYLSIKEYLKILEFIPYSLFQKMTKYYYSYYLYTFAAIIV